MKKASLGFDLHNFFMNTWVIDPPIRSFVVKQQKVSGPFQSLSGKKCAGEDLMKVDIMLAAALTYEAGDYPTPLQANEPPESLHSTLSQLRCCDFGMVVYSGEKTQINLILIRTAALFRSCLCSFFTDFTLQKNGSILGLHTVKACHIKKWKRNLWRNLHMWHGMIYTLPSVSEDTGPGSLKCEHSLSNVSIYFLLMPLVLRKGKVLGHQARGDREKESLHEVQEVFVCRSEINDYSFWQFGLLKQVISHKRCDSSKWWLHGFSLFEMPPTRSFYLSISRKKHRRAPAQHQHCAVGLGDPWMSTMFWYMFVGLCTNKKQRTSDLWCEYLHLVPVWQIFSSTLNGRVSSFVFIAIWGRRIYSIADGICTWKSASPWTWTNKTCGRLSWRQCTKTMINRPAVITYGFPLLQTTATTVFAKVCTFFEQQVQYVRNMARSTTCM